jgi:hypothetical protein
VLREQEKASQEKEEVIVNQRAFIDTQKLEIEKLRDVIRELNQKEQVLLDYTESLKRQQEEIKWQQGEGMQVLQELQKQDWSKQIIKLKKENTLLREELTQRQKVLADIKQNLSYAMQG